MELRTKKLLARETLILIVPVIVLIIVAVLSELYFDLRWERLENEYAEVSGQIYEDKKLKIDSIKRTDSIESIRIIEKMKTAGEASENIQLVREQLKNKEYSTSGQLTNIFGDTINVNPELELKRDAIQLKLIKGARFRDALWGDEYWDYDGLLGVTYFVFLILVYPIRLLFYVIIWAVKTLRTT
jgi:hypothetical protein